MSSSSPLSPNKPTDTNQLLPVTPSTQDVLYNFFDSSPDSPLQCGQTKFKDTSSSDNSPPNPFFDSPIKSPSRKHLRSSSQPRRFSLQPLTAFEKPQPGPSTLLETIDIEQPDLSRLPEPQPGPSRLPEPQPGPSRLLQTVVQSEPGPSRLPEPQPGPSRLPDTQVAPQPGPSRVTRKQTGRPKKYNMYRLTMDLQTDEQAIEFCRKYNLLSRYATCPTCDNRLDKLYCISQKARRHAQYRYQCNKKTCKKNGRNQVPLRRNSWFDSAHISFRKSILLIYCFYRQCDVVHAIEESSISDGEDDSCVLQTSTETVTDYYNYLREVCVVELRDNQTKLGGPGKTVEIDESKFGKTKYNRGRIIHGQWVVGGICRETGDVFLEPVATRDKETLLPLIQKHVAPGTHIMTDCWPAYRTLKDLGYTHSTVNHSENFVDPKTGACTNTIENTWTCIKRQLPSTHTTKEHFPLHLAEFMWRRKHEDDPDMFISLLTAISRTYPPSGTT